jgi:hypothetical protein
MTNISEQRLVMLFTEGLSKPQHGWVKSFKPKTLQDKIIKTLYMEGVIQKNKTISKPFIPQKKKIRNLFRKSGLERRS